ncbi:hypothetical protein [Sphingomonas sp. KC8]|uniref:hypothetical protein n=1 Tax=Sphingomonas sp. KC8 TaxID=1030157 RepID=UPI0002489C7A|nr:hypothetical protein [Sphingomonas sp. KC8]ARS29411.1 hypothetical protein KC8_19250 [Sphingomonas sp. KC8]
MDLATKTDPEIGTWIRNHEAQGKTDAPLYLQLLEERTRRAQATHKLDFDRSLAHLKQAAIDQVCTTYGALAAASGVDWSQARHQMNGANGHLDRLLDICHARRLPLLTAICVNQASLADGELGDDALAGFVTGARRLGLSVADARAFHHESRDKCWRWGRELGHL